MPENEKYCASSTTTKTENAATSSSNLLKTSSSPPLGPLKSLGGNTFIQYREELYLKLKNSIQWCRINYAGQKELANEQDDMVAELCEALEEVFSYGLKQQQAAVVVTAATIFQNMQEIVTGNIGGPNISSLLDTTFWDFCQMHLNRHEKERFENLRKVWTKHGRGKAFIRAALNEKSLQRYLLLWLKDEELLRRYYTSWSLLLNEQVAKELPGLLGSLDSVLFALTVDTTELNAATRFPTNATASSVPVKEEPIINAPAPIPVVSIKQKKKVQNEIERPITTATSAENLSSSLPEVINSANEHLSQRIANNEAAHFNEELPTDPIEPELEFLKEPLPDYYIEPQANHEASSSIDIEFEDKSDTSSLYSKSSSSATGVTAATQAILEKKLNDMTETCAILETQVAQLKLENRQLVRRLTKFFKDSGIDPDSSLSTNFLITIPQAILNKARHGRSSYYTYEVHITMRRNLEHWSVLRRYRDFYKLHKSLLRTHPAMSNVEFPPKKHFGNMNEVFVEERRQQLQIYLINLVETIPQVEACKTKAELQKVFPFLRER